MAAPKLVAFYLPQFHSIPENDHWWGPGFTEWRNVARARPLFRGHYQPTLPGELGFYDLRLDETRERQADLAAFAGISAFCYYHYWFNGKTLLERPLEFNLRRPEPSLPFCLCWANHDWTAHWAGKSEEILIKQSYPGWKDHRSHYEYLRRYFEDRRYFTIEKRPILAIFRPRSIPDKSGFVDMLKKWTIEDGFGELYMIGLDEDVTLLEVGFDAIAPHSLNIALASYMRGIKRMAQLVRHSALRYPRWVIDYGTLDRHFKNHDCNGLTVIPTVVPNWDNTPRIGRRGLVLSGSTPAKYAAHLRRSIEGMTQANGRRERLVFIKSWNEWAEGNYIEPDVRWGRGWLEATRTVLGEMKNDR